MATSAFGKAFAEARKAGKKTFDFGGKSYTTETREDVVRRRNEDAGKKSTAGEKTATTKAREYTSGLAKQERQAEREEASRANKAAESKRAADATSTARDKMAGESRLATKREREFKNMQSGEFPSVSNSRGNRKELETGPFKAGGKVKKYAEGGSVRGAGMAKQGVRKCKIV